LRVWWLGLGPLGFRVQGLGFRVQGLATCSTPAASLASDAHDAASPAAGEAHAAPPPPPLPSSVADRSGGEAWRGGEEGRGGESERPREEARMSEARCGSAPARVWGVGFRAWGCALFLGPAAMASMAPFLDGGFTVCGGCVELPIHAFGRQGRR
jgi:hypothetical protein